MTLSIENLAKSFQQGDSKLRILEGLALALKPAEIVAVVGESGSGKSTLLSLLAGFETPDSGVMKWNGDATANWDEERWSQFRKKSLGFVFQNYHLIPYLDALENVALPLRLNGTDGESAERAAKTLLEQLGLGGRVTHLPNQMSGGECQRVAIARALVHKPSLVLADEPTAAWMRARTNRARSAVPLARRDQTNRTYRHALDGSGQSLSPRPYSSTRSTVARLKLITSSLKRQRGLYLLWILSLAAAVSGLLIVDVYRHSLTGTLESQGRKILTADASLSARRILTEGEQKP